MSCMNVNSKRKLKVRNTFRSLRSRDSGRSMRRRSLRLMTKNSRKNLGMNMTEK